MDQTAAFLKRFGRRRNARHWVGPTPPVRAAAIPRAIAAQIDHPTPLNGWTEKNDLQRIERRQAAVVLAFAATESLARSNGPPRESYRKLAEAALAEFGAEAVFLTNARSWGSDGPILWSATLTKATFEAGLIAYDAHNAMVFWVEEED